MTRQSTQSAASPAPARLFGFALAVFIVGSLADIGTTHIGLTLAGLQEQNALAVYAMEQFGLLKGLVILKTGALIVMLGILGLFELLIPQPTKWLQTGALGFMGAGLIYLVVAVHNAVLIALA